MKSAVLTLAATVLSPLAATGSARLPDNQRLGSSPTADIAVVPIAASSRGLRGAVTTPSVGNSTDDDSSSYVLQCYERSNGTTTVGAEVPCEALTCGVYDWSLCADANETQCLLSKTDCPAQYNLLEIVSTGVVATPWELGCCKYS